MTEPEPPPPFNLILPTELMAGVWANFATVRHTVHEFTLDFVRADYNEQGAPVQGVVVGRINMSPLFVSQLRDALEEEWTKYAVKAMPKELNDGDLGG